MTTTKISRTPIARGPKGKSKQNWSNAATRHRPNRAVGSQRHESPKSLDDFPTPPWATRALCQIVLPRLGIDLRQMVVHEPAAGRGIMAEVLREYAASVYATDVHRYPDAIPAAVQDIGSYVGEGLDVLTPQIDCVDAVITNPPYVLAQDFLMRALREAEVVAMLLRSNWSEGITRYNEVFAPFPPLAEAVFVERVPMQRGRWNPNGKTLTAYSWFVWLRGSTIETRKLWIPPGQSKALRRPYDIKRFAALEHAA